MGNETHADRVENGGDSDYQRAAEKVRTFPQVPGVYLLKDSAGRVIYVGKAKNLRARAGSYFLKGAAEELRTATWVHEIADVDFLEAESEVDALLHCRFCSEFSNFGHARLISRKMTTSGNGFVRVCWLQSINAPRHATCASRKMNIAKTASAYACF